MEAKYFAITSFQSGISKNHYTCFIIIYGSDKIELKSHYLNDNYEGKWGKCSPIMNKWHRKAIKSKLERIALL